MVKPWRHSFSSGGNSSSSPTVGLKKYKPIRDKDASAPANLPRFSKGTAPPKPTIVTNKESIKKKTSRQQEDDSSIQNDIQVEIQGLSLLEERDDSMNKVQQANRIMYFNALQLIRKQKCWLEQTDTSDDKNKSTELPRKKKALEELEARIERASFEGSKSLPPQKALFKATALLDDTIESMLSGKQLGSIKSEMEMEAPTVSDDQERLPSSTTLLEFYPENDSCSEVYCDDESLGEKDMASDGHDSKKAEEEKEVRDSPVTDYDEWMNAMDERVKDTSEDKVLSDLVATESIAENNPFSTESSKWMDKIEEHSSDNNAEEDAPDRVTAEKALETILSTEDVLFEDPFSSNPFEDLEKHLKTTAANPEDTSKTETDETEEFGTLRIEI